jgi:hypothetical protein
VTALVGQTGSTLDELTVSFPAGHVERKVKPMSKSMLEILRRKQEFVA